MIERSRCIKDRYAMTVQRLAQPVRLDLVTELDLSEVKYPILPYILDVIIGTLRIPVGIQVAKNPSS
jgi:hypothetical protein